MKGGEAQLANWWFSTSNRWLRFIEFSIWRVCFYMMERHQLKRDLINMWLLMCSLISSLKQILIIW